MSKIGDLFKKAFSAKSYYGLLPGNLPSSTNWGATDFLKANDISLYTNRAIAKRAEKVSEIEFVVKNKKGEVIENHPILDVLHHPNDHFTGEQFWQLVQQHLDLVGCAYILIDSDRIIFESKKIKNLHVLMATNVTPKFDENNILVKYEYKTSRGTVAYLPEQVIYLFRPDPSKPMTGISLLKAGITAIQTEVQISAYHARILENGGKVEGVFKFKTPRLTKEQLNDLKAQYENEYADSRKSGRPLFLGGDAEYTKTGLTPDELSYLEAKKVNINDIVVMTGVPKPLLGSFDDIQFSNADAAIRIFLRETIKPLLRQLASALDKVLVPDGETLTFVDPTPENIDDKIKETESGMKNYYMTINEARVRHGLDPLPDGDVVMVPFNLIPLGEQSVVQDGNKDATKSLKTLTAHPLQDADVRKQYGIMQDKRIGARAKNFKKEVVSYMNDQRDRIITHLDPSKTRVFRKAGIIEDALQIELEVKIGKEKFIPTLTSLLAEAGNDAMDLVGSTYTFNMSAEVKTWLEQKADIFLRSITDTTLSKLKREFAESLANGETRDQLVARVQNTYKDISQGRAEVIARTEVHNVTQYGTMRGYQQAGLNIKIWVTVGDLDVRDSHASQDGEEKPIGMPFSNGLMFPGDPKGGPDETVNCRCVI